MTPQRSTEHDNSSFRDLMRDLRLRGVVVALDIGWHWMAPGPKGVPVTAPKLQVTGINHVVLHVTDVERSKRFYMDVLGFADRNISDGPPRMKASFLLCGVQGLDLFEVSEDAHGGQEMNHMALNVAADDVGQLVALLSEAGIEAVERTPRNSVFISDPDGHHLEILPRTASERARERQGIGLTV
jgi:catechol 2,3-dioxygenase-like lactoylglutathione lyase family enzyme